MKTTLLAFGMFVLTLRLSVADKPKSEIELQAERIGINYDRLEAAARRGRPEAVRVVLALRFDGGGGEMFQEHRRPQLLRGLPDDVLADALAELSPPLRREIIASMTAGITGAELDALQRRFPKSLTTFAPE